MEQPVCARLSDGRRLNFRHGPIDLVLQAWGPQAAVYDAEQAAWQRFLTILDQLCSEVAHLRRPARPTSPAPEGTVARRMYQSVQPFAGRSFITPMAAVAGAVADEILVAMTGTAELEKAYVNNGGDIALHLCGRASFTLGIVDRIASPHIAATARISAQNAVRGVATSGWGGRSFSLGIADAVTVLAETAAAADAAATLIANAVNLPKHPAIRRCPAQDLQPDSDLGSKPVTTGVGVLTGNNIRTALTSGLRVAHLFQAERRIVSATLFLRGICVSTNGVELADAAEKPLMGEAVLTPVRQVTQEMTLHA